MVLLVSFCAGGQLVVVIRIIEHPSNPTEATLDISAKVVPKQTNQGNLAGGATCGGNPDFWVMGNGNPRRDQGLTYCISLTYHPRYGRAGNFCIRFTCLAAD